MLFTVSDDRINAIHRGLHEAVEIGASRYCIGEDCLLLRRASAALTALYAADYAVIDLWEVSA